MARIPDETREAIAQDLRDGDTSVRAIATKHSVSAAFVSRLAGQIGVEPQQRSRTKRATEAKQVDIAAKQAEFAQLLVQDLFALRERAWGSQFQVVVVPMKGGGASTEVVEVPTSAGDFRNFYTSMGIVVDKIKVLTRDDSDGLAAVDAWLRSLGAGTTT